MLKVDDKNPNADSIKQDISFQIVKKENNSSIFMLENI
jgi:hypothetical protein